MKNARALDRLQNVLLAVLAASAALLLFFALTDETSLLYRVELVSGGEPAASAASCSPPEPALIAVRSGGSLESVGDGEGLGTYFERLRPTLIELFGTAGAPEQITSEAWLSALSQSGLMLVYGGELPLPVLTDGEGAALAAYSASQLFVSLSGETASLLFRSGSQLYSCASIVKSATFDTSYGGAPAGYACELGEQFAALAPENVVLRSASGSITLEPAVGDDGTFPRERLVLILSAFECSIYSAQSYQDSDGARIYLSEFGRIRLAPDGRVTFSADGGGIPVSTVAGSLSGSASANEARACSALISACCGSDAALRFCPISFGAGASDTVSYGLLADGLPVIREGGARAFAVFTFSGGALVFADMYVLTCSAQKGESLPELTPELLAAGLGGALPGGRLTPAFVGDGAGYSLIWTVLE